MLHDDVSVCVYTYIDINKCMKGEGERDSDNANPLIH